MKRTKEERWQALEDAMVKFLDIKDIPWTKEGEIDFENLVLLIKDGKKWKAIQKWEGCDLLETLIELDQLVKDYETALKDTIKIQKTKIAELEEKLKV